MKKSHGITDKKIIATLRSIANRNGGLLLAEDVLKDARSADSPLHDRFTWDDSEAAEKYRLTEASRLIQVSVEFIAGDPSETPFRVFVSLKSDRSDGKGYRRMIDVMNDEDLRKQLLADALTDLHAFSERYKKLQELAEVFQAIKKVRIKR